MSPDERIRHRFQTAREEINRFFHGEKWKEMLIFSLFILLAFGFWLLQSLQGDYEMEIRFPIEYDDIPSNIALEENAPQELVVKIKDKGSVLLNYSISHKRLPLPVLMNPGSEEARLNVPAEVIEAFVRKQLFATSRIVSITPQQVDVKYGQRKEKEIPVRFNGEILYKTGFQLSGEILIRPKHVKAYASQAILDTLSEACTAFTRIEEASKTFSKELKLEPIEGVNFESEYVAVIIPIEEYTEKTLDIPITCTGIPSNYRVRMFPASIAVSCRVPLSKFKSVNANDFEITIPFAELYQNTSGFQKVMLGKSPAWIHSATLVPDKIEFILEENHNY